MHAQQSLLSFPAIPAPALPVGLLMLTDGSLGSANLSQWHRAKHHIGARKCKGKFSLRRCVAPSADSVIAGYVEDVSKDVYEFKKDDKVAVFHVVMDAHCSLAEYAIASAHVTFHLPDSGSG